MPKDKEQMILDAAIQIFCSKGFGSATTAEIASEAGVAEGTVFRYFKTKKDILFKVFEAFAEIFAESIVVRPIEELFAQKGELDIKDMLKMVIKDRMDVIDRHLELVLVVMSEIRYHREIQDIIHKKILNRILSLLEAYIIKASEQGIIRDVPTGAVLRQVVICTMMYVLQRKVFPGMFGEPEDPEEDLDVAVDLMLRGILREARA